jgi:transcriptional regulator GlxA family with amidase domain
LSFAPFKNILEPTSNESLSLFMVTDHLGEITQPEEFAHKQIPHNDSFLENILQCIDNHLDNEFFGVEMLCKEIGISERQLQRKLKATTNKSPIQLISSVRLHRAKELLLVNKENIADIAFKTGFSNPSYFSKCFKKEFGLSPSDLLVEQY